eukprot:g4796.t1
MTSVTLATDKEREVAEALSTLRSLKCSELPDRDSYRINTVRISTTSFKSRSGTKSKSTKCNGIRKRRSKRRSLVDTEDTGSFSSGSYEYKKRRNRIHDKSQNAQRKQAVFRENGRRVYSSTTHSSSVLVANGRQSGVDLPSMKNQSHSTRRVDKSGCQLDPTGPIWDQQDTPWVLNGDHPVSQLLDEQNFPAAVRDAIERLYGSSIVCTRSEVQTVDEVINKESLHLRVPKSQDVRLENNSQVSGVRFVKNNARHVQLAQYIQNRMNRVNLMTGNRTPSMVPELPVPLALPSLSVPVPSLPQSWIRQILNSTASMNGAKIQCPSFSPQPPPLVRPSEPTKET